MTLEPTIQKSPGGVRRAADALFRWAGSLKLTILLLAILAGAVGYAMFLEAAKGRESAQWYVYRREWFLGLLGVLAANIAAVTAPRWRLRRPGLAIASAGLLVLLAGFIQTLAQGIEGLLILRPRETTQTVLRTDRSQLTLLTRSGKDAQSTEIGFSPGPADWRSGQPLDFGDVDGMGVKVLQFYRHARLHVDGVADEAGLAPPAIQIALGDSQDGAPAEHWCVPRPFGEPSIFGNVSVSIQQTSVPSFRDEFLRPPALKPESRGILSVHYKDRIYPISVDSSTGKKLPVGDSGMTVEIVEYYANAQSRKEGKFSSEGTEPKNPMLQLRIHAPDQKEPVSEIAFAKYPFMNHGSIKKQASSARFWYHHPAVKPATGVEFLQTPDGKLYCRVGDDGVYHPRGEVKEGDRIAVSADRQIALVRHIPHARPEGTFTPIELTPGETTEAEAAALVELTIGDRSERFWLGRNDVQRGRKLQTPDGPLIVLFGYERVPLGFSLKLVELSARQDLGLRRRCLVCQPCVPIGGRASCGGRLGERPAPGDLGEQPFAVWRVHLLSIRLAAVAQ